MISYDFTRLSVHGVVSKTRVYPEVPRVLPTQHSVAIVGLCAVAQAVESPWITRRWTPPPTSRFSMSFRSRCWTA